MCYTESLELELIHEKKGGAQMKTPVFAASRINWLKIGKIAVGAAAAMALAGAAGLQNAMSAGLIVFLTIQDTKKETVASCLRRLIAFVMMTALCTPIFYYLGTNPLTFGGFFLVFLLLCYGMDLLDSIAVNAVMATHYMAAGGVSLSLLKNEILLLLIGGGIGVFLNWFMPNNQEKIRRHQQELDQQMQGILERMAVYLLCSDRTGYDGTCFTKTDHLLAQMQRETVLFLGNRFTRQDLYFLRYAEMRQQQCDVLRMIYRQIIQLTLIPEQAHPLADFIRSVSQDFSEHNDPTALQEQLDLLHQQYRTDTLPVTRAEFENRALLFSILTDLRLFLKIKSDFFASEHLYT